MKYIFPTSYFFRRSCLAMVRELSCYLQAFQNKQAPIIIFSSRRSGSTLLAEIIARNYRVLVNDQPFCAETSRRRLELFIPETLAGEITSPEVFQKNQLENYLELLFTGKIRVNPEWRIWGKEFVFFPDRVLLKITVAKSLIDKIQELYPASKILILYRMPWDQIRSVTYNNWKHVAPAYLADKNYIERYLDESQRVLAEDLAKSDRPEVRYLADWILENVPILRHKRSDRMYIHFEELGEITATTRLFEFIGMPTRNRGINQINKRSKSSSHSPPTSYRCEDEFIGKDEILDLCEQFGLDLRGDEHSF